MKALRQLLASRLGLTLATLALALFVTSWSSSARAELIRLTYSDELDPAETFDEDCLGDSVAEDCDVRAALIRGELATLLSQLESDEDPETLALFQAALELDSPVVQAMAVQYLSRAQQQPDDFLAKVKTFFLGPDAPLGVSSSAVLETSADEGEQRLAELFEEQRPASAYAPQGVVGEPENDQLLQACIQDARLAQVESFAQTEQFQPAERLLMYDRFLRPFIDPTASYPVSAFVTDASLDDVSEFFSKLFGKPLGPVAGSQQRLAELSLQLVELQGEASGGDQEAIKKLQALADELVQTQQLVSLDSYMQLTAMHAENDLVWLDGNADDVASEALRAVTASEDSLLGKTVIRYLNATPGPVGGGVGNGDGGSNGDGNGNGNGQAGASPGPGGEPAEGGAASEAGRDVTGSDSGCGCSVPGAPAHGAGLSVLSLLAWALLRARRRSATPV